MISEKAFRRLEKQAYSRIKSEYESWLVSLSQDELVEYHARVSDKLLDTLGLCSPAIPDGEQVSESILAEYEAQSMEFARLLWLAGKLGQSNAITIQEWRIFEAEGHPIKPHCLKWT